MHTVADKKETALLSCVVNCQSRQPQLAYLDTAVLPTWHLWWSSKPSAKQQWHLGISCCDMEGISHWCRCVKRIQLVELTAAALALQLVNTIRGAQTLPVISCVD
jgi:hypothetical protein